MYSLVFLVAIDRPLFIIPVVLTVVGSTSASTIQRTTSGIILFFHQRRICNCLARICPTAPRTPITVTGNLITIAVLNLSLNLNSVRCRRSSFTPSTPAAPISILLPLPNTPGTVLRLALNLCIVILLPQTRRLRRCHQACEHQKHHQKKRNKPFFHHPVPSPRTEIQ